MMHLDQVEETEDRRRTYQHYTALNPATLLYLMEEAGTREHLVVVEELVLLAWGQTDDPVRHQQIKEQHQKGHQGEALLHTLPKKIMLIPLLECHEWIETPDQCL